MEYAYYKGPFSDSPLLRSHVPDRRIVHQSSRWNLAGLLRDERMCDSVTTTIDIVRFAQLTTLFNPYLLRIDAVCKLQYIFQRQVGSLLKESDRGW